MANEEQKHREEPIIIKKRKGHASHAAHGGAWKVAYADFVTAMMAFFIVMWILASSEQTKESITAYFQDPGAFSYITGKQTRPIESPVKLVPEKGKGEKGKGNPMEISFVPENDSAKSLKKATQDSADATKKVKETADALQKVFNELTNERPELEELLKSVKMEMTNEGLRVELIETSESMFFEVGSSKLKPKAIEIISQLAGEFGKLTNNIEVEGHTDSRGYGNNAVYSNWELSADRANAARRVLELKGLWPDQVKEVKGYADKKLRNPNNAFDVMNRRVTILVKNISAKEFIKNK
ncbi:MAG: OmpA family protein [Candidatus Kapabacteria bacterium]|nr:OmpA family protein [Candidatus Kapabacteria bacterium]